MISDWVGLGSENLGGSHWIRPTFADLGVRMPVVDPREVCRMLGSPTGIYERLSPQPCKEGVGVGTGGGGVSVR